MDQNQMLGSYSHGIELESWQENCGQDSGFYNVRLPQGSEIAYPNLPFIKGGTKALGGKGLAQGHSLGQGQSLGPPSHCCPVTLVQGSFHGRALRRPRLSLPTQWLPAQPVPLGFSTSCS